MAVGYVLYVLVSGWAAPAGRPRRGLGLRGRALPLQPGDLVRLGAVGPDDAVGALVLLLGVAALIRGNSEGAAGLAVVAAMVKPQYGVVLIPLVGVVLLKRHLHRDWTHATSRWGPARLRRAGWHGDQGPVRIVTSFLVAWIVFFAMALPFAMGPYEYLAFVAKTAGGTST